MFVYVGTFTETTRAQGISVYRMDVATGALALVQTVPGLLSPSFLALHPTGNYLYAVERHWTPERRDVGAVTAFRIEGTTGRLTSLDRRPSGGVSPAHVSVHPSGRFALAAHYGSGQVAALPIGPDGCLGGASDIAQHAGRGPDPVRQEGPHAHFVAADPSGRYILACDLGIDRVMVSTLDLASGKLLPNGLPFAQVSSGAGPRHLAFHPSGRYVYVINELDSTLSAFAFDAARGALQILQTVSTLPGGCTGPSHTAQVVVHPSGRFVYGSNRGHDSVVTFAIDATSGRLTLVDHAWSGGKTPRNFNIDPTGTFLLVGNEESDTIVTFRIDRDTGRIAATGQAIESPSPVCIQFLAAAGR
jgi:6-phosphogluconolactonase